MKDGIRGFTLLELMVVIAIVGILAMVAFAKYTGFKYRAARAEAYHNLDAVRICEEAYQSEHQRYMLSNWNPSSWTPDPLGTYAWDENSGFKSIGFKPKGKKKYKYAVDGYSTPVADPYWLGGDGNTTISNGEQGRNSSDQHDICMMAVGDLDGDGDVAKLYLTDEPPDKIMDANPGEY